MRDNQKGEGKKFIDTNEILKAIEVKEITLHTKIYVRFKNFDGSYSKVETTAGRMLLADSLPKNEKIEFNLINKVLTKKEVSNLIDIVYRFCGQKETVLFADSVMQIGCLLYTSPSPRDKRQSRMPSSA